MTDQPAKGNSRSSGFPGRTAANRRAQVQESLDNDQARREGNEGSHRNSDSRNWDSRSERPGSNSSRFSGRETNSRDNFRDRGGREDRHREDRGGRSEDRPRSSFASRDSDDRFSRSTDRRTNERSNNERRNNERSNNDRVSADRPFVDRRGGSERPSEPSIPDHIEPSDLDPTVRADLRALDKSNADMVARHLVMVSELLSEDPQKALEHARAARARAGRLAVVRETVGIAAYSIGEWTEAISELRAARRMSGSDDILPLIADAERGLGRPDRAIDIARGEEGRALEGLVAAEMRIVESGARLDLGEPEKAISVLQMGNLDPSQVGGDSARYFFAYASALEAAGRREEAITWFMNAASADEDDETDAELRLAELTDAELSVAQNLRAIPGPVVPEATEGTLRQQFTALLLDLDGTVYAGETAVPNALDALVATADPDQELLFVTNNASRSPKDVANHLTSFGFSATADSVVTSAQSAARLLREQLVDDALVLVVGTQALVEEVEAVGLRTTVLAADKPVAVVQGHSPETSWSLLSEAALAITAGALWIACNVDPTLPTERGQLLGNGSMVAAVANATGKRPLVAGKPFPALLEDAINRSNVERPLVIGDRLDTDIAGANAIGAPSLLVLTGVSTTVELVNAEVTQRPTYLARNLLALNENATSSVIGPRPGWNISVNGTALMISSGAEAVTEELLPALLFESWQHPKPISGWSLSAADTRSREAIELWKLGELKLGSAK